MTLHRIVTLLGCLIIVSDGFSVQPRGLVRAHARGCFRQHDVLYQQREGDSQSGSFEIVDDAIRHKTTTRREWWATTMRVVSSSTLLLPLPAMADDVEEKEGLVSTKRIADLLRAVPTFTIVDQKGVPYMVVGEDAKVTGYFFIDYNEAKRILQVADQSADRAIAQAKKEDPAQAADLVNPWKGTRISTVPLDFAVTLITKSLYDRRAGGNYFQIAPSPEDIENALTVTGKDDLAEGKVPLFYFEDFTLPTTGGSSSSSATKSQTPLFFQRKQLEEAYRSVNGKSVSLPPVKVTELFALLLEMVKPGGTDTDLQNLVFVAPTTSAAAVKTCQKRGGKEPPFSLGQRNIIL